MLIVIEGVDRTGKTSLAKRIQDKTGGRIIHAGPPTRHPLEEYETALDGYDPRGGKTLILDRWHIGEYVWPTIFGRETLFNEAVQRHVEMFMRSRGAFLIYAERNPEKLIDELVKHNEPLKPESLNRAIKLFRDAVDDTSTPYGFWDYERYGDAEVDNFIWTAEGYASQVTRVWDVCGPGWVGSEVPQTLLVGDELGPLKSNTNPPDDIPFAPYATTSGRYLLDSLPQWKTTALVNSLQGREQTPRNLGKIWVALGMPTVVALGTKASAALKQNWVPHGDVPHPQYWRRFHYNDRQKYIDLIKEASCQKVGR